ncbi:hypothetical protein [Actinacidiphila sp. ITFR-21]|uniref:hypothetical protein n=1 Tax=Actinacidiphila sp. ITFR-21 TaxID=3075199 RepID=UPI00288A43F8|nr:hypothetical protein [Streptomyces sp. ITFR-21]WNI16494.1 hypothetical protein RLT57_13860 [Streptomyces sp. ITFR-21]
MNVCRILTSAAVGSFLLAAAAPLAQAATPTHAADLGSTLTGTAITASSVGAQAGAAAHNVVNQTGVGQKVTAVDNAVQAGAAAVSAGDHLING